MERKLVVIFSLIMVFVFIGCAGLTPPNPMEILSHPLGTEAIRIGMTKEKVKDLWGEADVVNYTGKDELGTACEEWIYWARHPELRIDAGYLSKTQRLYFEGNALVKWKN